jgi:hypothetical protein
MEDQKNQAESMAQADAAAQQELSAPKADLEALVNADATETEVTPAEVQQALEELDNAERARSFSLLEKAYRKALTQLGKGETPPGSNCQVFSRYFGAKCQYWCADFVSWAIDSVSNQNKKLPWSNPSAVSSILDWARKNDKLVKTPKPGDIFILKGNGVSHTGFVRFVRGNSFTTVEGNSGDKVRSLTRSLKTSNLYFVRFTRDR